MLFARAISTRYLNQSFLSVHTHQFRPPARKLSMAADKAHFNDSLDGPTFEFPEEPLGLPADVGFGFFQGGPGDVLSGRYLLQAKLGYGTTSSVWLAKDNQSDRYFAVKVLSGYATRLNNEHKLRELDVHARLITTSQPEDRIVRLRDHFVHCGIDDDGEHLCLVFDLQQASLKTTWNESHALPVQTVKRIMLDVLQGVSVLHNSDIAHTDLKPDNIMILLSSQCLSTLDAWVATHPPRVYGNIQSLHKVIDSAFVTEDFPKPSVEDLDSSRFLVGDLGHSQFVDEQTTDDISPLTLRAPEVMLGGAWTQSVDIWSIGVLLFTMMTGKRLFSEDLRDHHKQFLRKEMSTPLSDEQAVEVLLWQMTMFTGRHYPAAAIPLYPLGGDYFNKDATLKSFREFAYRPLQTCMRDAGFNGSDEDVKGACKIMYQCLNLNPVARPSALQLLEQDEWLRS